MKTKKYFTLSNLLLLIGLIPIISLTCIDYVKDNQAAFIGYGLYMICAGIAIKLVKLYTKPDTIQ